MRYLWIALGWTSITLGVIGAVLPLLPTTPFLLLAAFAFSRGSNHLHDWLINHHTMGPPIINWQRHRCVSRQVKVVASISICALLALSLLMQVPAWALASQALVLVVVLAILWTRREHPATSAADECEPAPRTPR